MQIETDWFYRSIRKGFVPTWLADAQTQNITVLDALVAAAKEYARGGYAVYVDGIIGPWYLTPWIDVVKAGCDIRLIVLKPSLDVTLARAKLRQGAQMLKQPELIGQMWTYFSDLGSYQSHEMDTSDQSIDESLAAIARAIAEGRFRLKTHEN